jgi:cobalt-zinc-cadmium efflux system outer membrane protein
MMMMKNTHRGLFRRAVLLLMGTTCLSLGAWAEGPSDAPAADPVMRLVGEALEHNPGLAAQRNLVEAAEQGPSQAEAFPDPSADLEFMAISAEHPSLSNAVSRGVSLGVTQMVPYPGKRRLKGERAEREADVARAKLEAMKSELRGDVTAAAYRYALLGRLLSINDLMKDALTAASASAAGVYASGAGSQTDVLLAQTALTKNRAEREDLERQFEITAARLKDLLGGALDRSIADLVTLPEPEELPELSTLTGGIDESAPRIMMAQAEVAARDAGVALAKKDFKPDFMVGARYRHRDMTMDGRGWVTVMAGISLPFFHYKSRYRPALQESLLKRESARQRTDDVRNEVLYGITEAYQSALRDKEVYALYKGGLLIQARQTYEASIASYSVGRSDFATLLSALTNLYAYEGQADMAKADFQGSIARLEALLGRAGLRHPQQLLANPLSKTPGEEIR